MFERILGVIATVLGAGGPPRPNRSLEDVVKRITGFAALPRPDPNDDVHIVRACAALREMALVSPLSIFGGIGRRSSPPADYRQMTRDLIPRDFWQNHRMELTGFLGEKVGDRRGRTRPTGDIHGSDDEYYGIWFDKREIDKFWPPSKK